MGPARGKRVRPRQAARLHKVKARRSWRGLHLHTFTAPAYAMGVDNVVRDMNVVLADKAFGRGNACAMC